MIAVDAMGGDDGLAVMLAGVARARRRFEGTRFLLVGDEQAIRDGLVRHPGLTQHAEIVHAPGVVTSSEKPTQAIRRAKTTSMGIAIDLVKQRRAAAAVSSGNTGALMAMAKISLRMLPGIDRPALAALLPTLGDTDMVMLDLGANTECDARNLVQFAVMGAAYARTTLDLENPRVALLNIGSEDMKGTDEIRDAAALLRASTHLPMRFEGFIEGDRLSRGEVDVIVCDGFSGNIALKTAEGTVRFVTDLLRRAFSSSARSKIGFPDLAPRDAIAARSSRSEQSQWRGLSRAERYRREEPWQRERDRRRHCDRQCGEDGAQRTAAADRRRSGTYGAGGVIRSVITGTGSALPARRVSNAELAMEVDTTDDWIVERTGIRFRHIAGPDETTATLAADACKAALAAAGVLAQDIDLIVLATATPDQTFPASATKVQAMLGIDDCVAFDVAAVCSGFLYAVQVADSMLRSGAARARIGDRRGDVQPHTRLGGPHHLRPVRRRCGCDRAGGARERRGGRARYPRRQAARGRPP